MANSRHVSLERGDAVNLASNLVAGGYKTKITDKGVKALADAVLLMDAELRRLYAVSENGAHTLNSIKDDARYHLGCWDNDARTRMAQAALQSCPKLGQMETAHKVVSAVIKAQEGR